MWPALNQVMTGLIVLTVLILIVLAFLPEVQKQKEAKRKIRALQNQIANQEQVLHRKERELELLKTSPEYVEIIARDKMDLMKDGETIFRLDSNRRKSSPSLVPQP